MAETPINPNNPYGLTTKQAFFHPVTVGIFLLLFFPIGLLLMWLGNVWSMWVRVFWTLFFGAIFMMMVQGPNYDHLPKEQVAYAEKVEALQDEYYAAKDKKNEPMVDVVLDKSHQFLNARHEMNGWHFKVNSVDKLSDDRLRLSAEDHRGYAFYLHTENPNVQETFKRIVAGNRVSVNGYTSMEKSLTKTGMITEPEVIAIITSWAY